MVDKEFAMSSVHPIVRRIGGPVALSATVLALVAVNAAAAPAGAAEASCPANAPVLELANPHPGDVLPNGHIVISGLAFDPAAASGVGISRVDLFLGARDSGGVIIGSAAPASPVFEIMADIPDATTGGRDFVAYTYSTANGHETSVSVPVFIGAAPTATPTGSSAAAPVAPPASRSACAVVVPGERSELALRPLPLAPTVAAPFLQLANPAAGELLSNGDVIIQGRAYDPAATSGAGVDRVELFLDPREEGGAFLGEATPTGASFAITAKIANTANGGHRLVGYARSSVTGLETSVAVPMFVGAAPTATPRPVTTESPSTSD
jgi:hypothetical protein